MRERGDKLVNNLVLANGQSPKAAASGSRPKRGGDSARSSPFFVWRKQRHREFVLLAPTHPGHLKGLFHGNLPFLVHAQHLHTQVSEENV